MELKNVWLRLKEYFNLMSDKEDEHEVIEQVRAGVMFRGTNLWILIFAILIASLGLNVNSTAVIIGAMLISPLMGPILGMGLSVGIGDSDLRRRALKNYGVATLISIVTATLYFLISPLGEAQSELLARTSPSLFDVLIAFCGGAAGVLALTTKSKGQVIPGVAIATALMPPLCTAGYGLATAQWNYFFGAFYLFFINTVFIALSTFLGVKLLRFRTKSTPQSDLTKRGRRLVMWVVVITMLPAAVMTVNIVQRNVFDRNVHQFVERELRQTGTRIISAGVEADTLHVVAVGRTIGDAEVADARSRMDYYGLGSYSPEVIQGGDSEDLELLASQLTNFSTAADAEKACLGAEVQQLGQQLEAYTRYDSRGVEIDREAVLLFTPVDRVGVGRLSGTPTAVVTLKPGAQLAPADRSKLQVWLEARLQEEVDLVIK